MSVENEETSQEDNGSAQPASKPDAMSRALANRDAATRKRAEERRLTKTEKVEEAPKEAPAQQKEADDEEETPQKKVTEKKSVEKKEKEIDKKPKPQPVEEDDDEEEEEQPEHVIVLEKTKKRLNDAQNWGNSINRKLKAAERVLEEDLEAGKITEEQFDRLKEAFRSEHPEPTEEPEPKSSDPLSNLVNIAISPQNIKSLRDALGEDEEIFYKKAVAFDFFMDNASPQERKNLYEDLADLEESPLKLARKIYSIGEREYEGVYKDIDEAGGVKALLEVKNKQLESRQKTIDKLKKKLSQYEDHDKPTIIREELGLDLNQPQKPRGDAMDRALASRDRQKFVMRRQ